MSTTEVFIFSYNRGRFLQNCVQSAQKHIPNVSITVIDDHSNDEYTKKILSDLSKEVVVKEPIMQGKERWGGFYNNINWVIQELATKPWVILIEDDMQFIRPFLEDDSKRITNFFKNNPKAGYLTLEFMKEEHRGKDKHTLEIDKSQNMYFYTEAAVKYRGTIHICSSGVLNIKYMREVGYTFLGDRPTVRERGRTTFSKKGVYPYPLLMYLPSPPTIKNRSTTITRKLVERYYRTGFYPYQEMSEEELARFLNRDISILPYTGDWLKTKMPSPGPPYVYADSMKMANRWMQQAEKLETLIRSKF